MNKYITTALVAGTVMLGGTLLVQDEKAPVLDAKPVLDTSIDTAIVEKQSTYITKNEMIGEKFIGDDGIERNVIPYNGPKGKGYIIEYKKTVTLTDKNGSTTEKTYYQQIDYGPEGRTNLW